MILDSDQRAAATHQAPILRIDAGPGSGKTAVLAARAAWLIESGAFSPGQVVALTFTRAMAADLRRRIGEALPADMPCRACNGAGRFAPEHDGATGYDCGACAGTGRISAEGVVIGTLHSLAARWVRLALAGTLAGGREVMALGVVRDAEFGIALPEDVEDMIAQAQEAIGAKKITQKALRGGLRLYCRDLAGWPEHTEARRQLHGRNLATYDDLLVMLDAVACTAHAGGGERFLREAHPCLLVDEAQDLSAQHWAIISAWSPGCLTYVGDDGQAIYGFLAEKAGASEPVAEARANFDGLAVRVQLGRNYRSRPFLVAACDAVRQQLTARGACSDLPLVPARAEAAGSIDLFDHTQSPEMEHSARVVEAVQRALCVADRPEDVVVLSPLHAELDEIAEALAEAGIPAAKLERTKGAWQTTAGRALVAMCRAAELGYWTRFDATLVLRACALDPAALGDVELRAMSRRCPLALALDDEPRCHVGAKGGWWQAVTVARGNPTPLDTLAVLAYGLRGGIGGGIATAADALKAWSDDWTGGRVPGPADFVLWLASSETATAAIRKDGHVCLSTLHGAKGLEWGEVVLAGASDGCLPPVMARGNPERENDWLRALYVGMTRASEGLAIVCPQVVRGKARHPSRVLIDAGIARPNPNVEE